MVGVIGSVYALFGGLRTVAVSDTLNGIGLLVGRVSDHRVCVSQLGGEGGFLAGAEHLIQDQRERFNSVGDRGIIGSFRHDLFRYLPVEPVLLDDQPADHPADLWSPQPGRRPERRTADRCAQAAGPAVPGDSRHDRLVAVCRSGTEGGQRLWDVGEPGVAQTTGRLFCRGHDWCHPLQFQLGAQQLLYPV